MRYFLRSKSRTDNSLTTTQQLRKDQTMIPKEEKIFFLFLFND